MSEMTTAAAIVKWLLAQKVIINSEVQPYFPGVFSIFGHGNALGLGDALSDSRDLIQTFRGQSEEGMALAAVGYTKAMRRQQAMVVTTSIGPGALNVVTAAGTALANRLPMLVLSGDTYQSRNPDPVLQQVEHFGEPSTTVNDAFRAVVRYWDRITSPTQILTSLPYALMTMLDPASCGPVFIGLPQDIQAQSFDFPDAFFEETIHGVPRPRADKNEIDAAIKLIKESKRPVLVAGGGVHYSLAETELVALAEKLNIPVVETMAGKACVSWSNPLLVGPLGVTGSDPVNTLISESDLIIAIGTRLQDFTTGSWTLFGQKQIIAVNTARFDASKRRAVAVVGDAREVINELSAALAQKKSKSWSDRALELKRQCETDRNSRRDLDSALPTYAQVVIATNDVARDDDYVLTAAGGLPGELNNNWLTKSIATFDCEYGFSCMGYEISGAFGAAIAQKRMKGSGRVIAMTGDGSYLMLSSDVYSAVLHDFPLTLILCDNGGFAVISRLQTGNGADSFRTMITENPTAARVDFVAHAASMGADTYRVRGVEELKELLTKTENSPKVVVIVIDTAPTTWTEGGAFWEVGVPTVSNKPAVREARAKIDSAKQEQRIF